MMARYPAVGRVAAGGVLCASILISAQAWAGQSRTERIQVELRRVEGTGPLPESASVVARMPSEGIERTAARLVSGKFELLLDRIGEWEVFAAAPGWWGARTIVRLPSVASGPLGLAMAPEAEARGTLALPRGERLDQLRIRLLTPLDRSSKSATPPIEAACSVREAEFSCKVPAGRWDLRLGAAPFVPQYRWGVLIPEKGFLEIGRVPLARGSSVSGLAVTERGAPLEAVEVKLRPVEFAGLEPPAKNRPEFSARSGPRGFFQFQGIPPGAYELSASSAAGGSGSFSPLKVFAEAESFLEKPLVLKTPVPRTAVTVLPSLDPVGEEWRLEIRKRNRVAGLFQTVRPAVALNGGVGEVRDLLPDDYLAVVTDTAQSIKVSKEFTVSSSGDPVTLEVDWLLVRGTVEYGTEPLRADLWFGGKSGATSVKLSSNENGEFAGVLPRSGSWTVFVESESPALQRRVPRVQVEEPLFGRESEVEIRLGANKVIGTVVGTNDEPVPSARIHAELLSDPLSSVDAHSGAGGEFVIAGLEEGFYRLRAEGASGKSRPAMVSVVEGRASELTLRLEDESEVVGTVRGAYGPIPGAMVVALDEVREQTRAATEADGSFALKVRSSTTTVSLVVLAPGHSLAILPGIPVRKDPIEVLISQAGGTLVLDLPEFPRDPGLALWLNKDGVFLDLPLLDRWAMANGGLGFGGQPSASATVEIPRMEPGDYRLCWIDFAGSARGCAQVALADGSAAVIRPPKL